MKERFRLKINMGYWSKNKEHFCRKNRNTGKKRNHRKYSLHFFSQSHESKHNVFKESWVELDHVSCREAHQQKSVL